jgi:hypothetical protein
MRGVLGPGPSRGRRCVAEHSGRQAAYPRDDRVASAGCDVPAECNPAETRDGRDLHHERYERDDLNRSVRSVKHESDRESDKRWDTDHPPTPTIEEGGDSHRRNREQDRAHVLGEKSPHRPGYKVTRGHCDAGSTVTRCVKPCVKSSSARPVSPPESAPPFPAQEAGARRATPPPAFLVMKPRVGRARVMTCCPVCCPWAQRISRHEMKAPLLRGFL